MRTCGCVYVWLCVRVLVQKSITSHDLFISIRCHNFNMNLEIQLKDGLTSLEMFKIIPNNNSVYTL